MTIRKHSQNTVTRSEFTCVRDGLVIRGTQLRPVGVKLPAVILSHGFNGNRKGVLKYAEVVARWGYTAFCFDFCGGGPDTESDGQTYDMTVFSEKEDLKAVLQYVKSLAYIDSSRIILMGFSQGGFVSALAATELPEQVAKLVLFYPALCIPDDARRGRMMQASFSPEHIPDLIPCGSMVLGHDYPALVLGMEPFREVCTYPGPTLILHGTEDTCVPPSYSRRAAERYPDCQLLLITGAGHHFNHSQNTVALKAVWRFLSGKRKLLAEVRSTHLIHQNRLNLCYVADPGTPAKNLRHFLKKTLAKILPI